MDFAHVACAETRAYLLSEESTTLDLAGGMIDRAEAALASDMISDTLSDRSETARSEALAEACSALGERDSIGVRRALRDFWNS